MPITNTGREILKETTALKKARRRPGIVQCLGCDRPFHSWHIAKNRLCPICLRHSEDE